MSRPCISLGKWAFMTKMYSKIGFLTDKNIGMLSFCTFFCKFLPKNLVVSKNSRTFAPANKEQHIGALVQLVRIHACHAWGHGFESRTHRNIFQNQLAEFHFGFCFFCPHKIAAPRPQKIDNVCPFYQKTKRKSALSSGKSVFLQKEGACSFFGRLPVYPIIKICQRKHSRR